jgi:hypothetical protein
MVMILRSLIRKSRHIYWNMRISLKKQHRIRRYAYLSLEKGGLLGLDRFQTGALNPVHRSPQGKQGKQGQENRAQNGGGLASK